MSHSDKIVQATMAWLGTPYHHQARVKGVGVDCAQLVAGVAIELGLMPADIQINSYSVEWHLHNREEKMCNLMESFGCIRKDEITPERGDIICFQFGRVCSHLGIYLGDQQFVHARIDQGKVVVNTLSGEWLERHKRTYSFPLEQIR